MIDTQGLAKMLMGTWDQTKQPLKERSTILPIGEYEDGSVSLAWPGLIAAPVEGMANFGSFGYDSPEAMALNARSAFDVAGAAMIGGLATGVAGGMVDNALGSAGGRVAQAAERQPQGIRAYHGSPHDFDQFSLDKIGTGEGAQAYGHGLYFAEAEDVARSYRDDLTKRKFDPDLRAETPELRAEAEAWLQRSGYDGTPDEINQTVQQITQSGFNPTGFNWNAVGVAEPKGRMYEVNINADPADFLDWDKPLSQQSEAVRRAVESGIGEKAQDPMFRRMFLDSGKGEGLLGALAGEGYDKAAATAKLREAGIPGIKYLDQMSRGAGEGTANYVVFDDQLIDILRKYANAPTGAAVPIGLEAQQETDLDPVLMNVLRQYGLMPSN